MTFLPLTFRHHFVPWNVNFPKLLQHLIYPHQPITGCASGWHFHFSVDAWAKLGSGRTGLTKFVSAKFSICQVWEHWDTAKYLLTTSDKHHCLFAVRRKGYMRSQESWTYGDLSPLRSNMLPWHITTCVLVFFFLEFVQLRQQLLLLLWQWKRHLVWLQCSGSRNNFSRLRTEILQPKIEIKFSWCTFSIKSWCVN